MSTSSAKATRKLTVSNGFVVIFSDQSLSSPRLTVSGIWLRGDSDDGTVELGAFMFKETLRKTLKQSLRQTIKVVGLLAVMFSLPLEARTYKIATVAPDGLGWIKDLRQAFKTIDAETEGREI